MLTSLKIQNFRRFRNLEFPTLKRVNLITGRNNTGKTAILEALLLLLEPRNFFNLIPAAFRNCEKLTSTSHDLWNWLFYNYETKTNASVSAGTEHDGYFGSLLMAAGSERPHTHLDVANDHGLRVAVPHKIGPGGGAMPIEVHWGALVLSVRPTDPITDGSDFDRVVLMSHGEERLENLLKKLFPDLRSIRSIKGYGAPLIYVDVGLPKKIPIVHLGQGFCRLVSIYSQIIASGKKIILIDEFENGLHYSALTDIWRGIISVTEGEDLQIFATTHSYECIRAAHAAFAETMPYDFALHRLEDVRGEVKVTTYDKATLETSLSSNFEIR